MFFHVFLSFVDHLRINRYVEDIEIIRGYKDLMSQIRNPVGLTLDMKQMVKGEKLDLYSVSQTIRHYLSRLNRKIFGNCAQKRGRKIQVVPVIEGGGQTGVRIHAHLTIGCPDSIEIKWFKLHLIREWQKCRFSYNFHKISQIEDYSGWQDYLLKIHSKCDGISSSIDTSNLHI
jgi:hypothetical protein